MTTLPDRDKDADPTSEPKHTGTGRPKSGYRNAAGKKVPGVTTIVGRWKESGGLIQWAWQCGADGISLDSARESAYDAGTAAHDMVDCYLHGREFDRSAWRKETLAKADHCFLAFLEWVQQTKLTVTSSEIPLVSEKYQFGGTFDAIYAAGSLRLLDYKTSNGIYSDMIIQVAGGYSLLWQEHHPQAPLTGGMDILRIGKPKADDDPVCFEHRHFSAEIFPIAQRQFLLFREAYELDKRLKGLL